MEPRPSPSLALRIVLAWLLNAALLGVPFYLRSQGLGVIQEVELTSILLPVSLAFIGSAPSIFQFPGTNEDPVTYALTALATFRAISSLCYVVFFHVHVRQRVKDVAFAMEHIRPEKPGAPTSWKVWVLLSFPAAATGWTVLLYMGALTSFVLRAGAATSPSPIRLPLIALIVTGAVADGLCMVWVCISLRGYGKDADMGERKKESLGEAPWGNAGGNKGTTCQRRQVCQ